MAAPGECCLLPGARTRPRGHSRPCSEERAETLSTERGRLIFFRVRPRQACAHLAARSVCRRPRPRPPRVPACRASGCSVAHRRALFAGAACRQVQEPASLPAQPNISAPPPLWPDMPVLCRPVLVQRNRCSAPHPCLSSALPIATKNFRGAVMMRPRQDMVSPPALTLCLTQQRYLPVQKAGSSPCAIVRLALPSLTAAPCLTGKDEQRQSLPFSDLSTPAGQLSANSSFASSPLTAFADLSTPHATASPRAAHMRTRSLEGQSRPAARGRCKTTAIADNRSLAHESPVTSRVADGTLALLPPPARRHGEHCQEHADARPVCVRLGDGENKSPGHGCLPGCTCRV